MRRIGSLALAAAAVALVAGCGSSQRPAPPVPKAAGAQQATLDWVESTGSPRARLVFRVRHFSVTDGGWSASVSVTNATTATFTIDGISEPFRHAFGVMLFGTGSHAELESRNRELSLPVLREAMTVRPALPTALRPRDTWAGTLSSRGALPSGAWVRVVFGAFTPEGTMPDGLVPKGNDVVTWITDHALRIR